MLERAYQPRVVDGLIRDLLRELPAVMVTGPRAAGKTTTAERHAASVVHLDRPAEAAAFRADPDVALAAHDEPVPRRARLRPCRRQSAAPRVIKAA